MFTCVCEDFICNWCSQYPLRYVNTLLNNLRRDLWGGKEEEVIAHKDHALEVASHHGLPPPRTRLGVAIVPAHNPSKMSADFGLRHRQPLACVLNIYICDTYTS